MEANHNIFFKNGIIEINGWAKHDLWSFPVFSAILTLSLRGGFMDYATLSQHKAALQKSNSILPTPTGLSRGEISAFAAQWFEKTCQCEGSSFKELAENLNVDLHFYKSSEIETVWKVSPHGVEILSAPYWGFETDRRHIMMGFALKQLYPGTTFELEKFDRSEQASKIKEEAIWFTWGAFMPRANFEEQAALLKGSVQQLAWHYHAKQSEIISRAKSLSLDLESFKSPSPRF